MYPKLVAISAALPLLLAGCQSTRVDDVATAPTKVNTRTSPGIRLNAEDQAAVDAVWATYAKLNTIYIKAAQTGTYNWDDDPAKRPLYEYAGGQFLAALERDLGFMNEEGIVRTGEPKVSLRRVVSVSATSILVESCVDDTGVDAVDNTTRKSVAAPNQNKRYPVTLRAGLFPDGQWRWVQSQADRASSC
jgi:hypothetical protein